MLFGLLVAVLAVAAAYWLARSITRPLQILTGAAIRRGRFYGAGRDK
jgi:nitrogen fixation/metabolism regulation signal transduction histidine kinase